MLRIGISSDMISSPQRTKKVTNQSEGKDMEIKKKLSAKAGVSKQDSRLRAAEYNLWLI